MTTKKLPPAYIAVKRQWVWAFWILAQELGKSKSTVSATLRKWRIRYYNKFKYHEAINKVFDKNYSLEELFPTQ